MKSLVILSNSTVSARSVSARISARTTCARTSFASKDLRWTLARISARTSSLASKHFVLWEQVGDSYDFPGLPRTSQDLPGLPRTQVSPQNPRKKPRNNRETIGNPNNSYEFQDLNSAYFRPVRASEEASWLASEIAG